MFLVKNDAGYNCFYLASWGWTVDPSRAIQFASRAAANVAQQRAFKGPRDRTSIVPA